MGVRNSSAGWGWPARLLHWSMAALLVFQVIWGEWMTDIKDVYLQFAAYQTHKSYGFVAFVLVALRLLWRLVNPTPAESPQSRPWERKAARLAHVALYVLMFALPLTGWLMASASPLQDAYGIKNMVFGLFEMPDPFVPGSEKLADFFEEAHEICVKLLILVVALHVVGALKHQLIYKDSVLRRMIRG